MCVGVYRVPTDHPGVLGWGSGTGIHVCVGKICTPFFPKP